MNNINVYLRLINARRFAAGMHSASASVGAFQSELEAADGAGGRFAATTNIMEAGVYALGASLDLLAGTLTVAAGAVGYFGIQFNATMESNVLAFENFAGGVRGAERLTAQLFEIASKTPFSFEDITTATRRFGAFGFSVKESLSLLDTLGDTLSYTGGSTDEVLRMAKAFGDIRAKGRLMGQELLQLTNLNLPVYDILSEELGLGVKEMQNIAKEGIPAKKAIDAIQRGLEKRFGGGAVKYMQTFNGQVQRAQDNFKLMSGALTEGLFVTLKGVLTDANDRMEKLAKLFGSQAFKDWAGGIGEKIGNAFGFMKDRFNEVMTALAPAAPFFNNVLLPILKGVAIGIIGGVVVAFKVLMGVINVVAPALGILGTFLEPLKPAFQILGNIIGFIFAGPLTALLGGLSKFGIVLGAVGTIFRIINIPMRLAGVILGGLVKAFMYVSRAALNFIGGLIARFAPGLGRMITAVVNFGGNLRSKFVAAFKSVLTTIGGFSTSLFNAGVKLGDKLFVGFKERLLKLFAGGAAFFGDIGEGLREWINANTMFGDEIKILGKSARIPALAEGGDITRGGVALVGENGPELARFAAGSSVVPLRAASAAPIGAGSGVGSPQAISGVTVSVRSPIYIDRRQIAEAYGEYMEDRRSRG